MNFGASTRADMQDLLADIQSGPLVDAYGNSCFQAAHRVDDFPGSGGFAHFVHNAVAMGEVLKPDFNDAAIRRHARLQPPSLQLKPRTPAPRTPAPRPRAPAPMMGR